MTYADLKATETGSALYTGLVLDDLDTLPPRSTRRYNTYREAHRAAEMLCKQTYKSRGCIAVITR